MLKSSILAIQRWNSLRSLSRSARNSSYIVFDYFVSFGGLHERVTICEIEGRYICTYNDNNLYSGFSDYVIVELTKLERNTLFQWVVNRLKNDSTILNLATARDPAKLKLFVNDLDRGWKCAVYLRDVSVRQDLRSFRYEFINEVKRLARPERSGIE